MENIWDVRFSQVEIPSLMELNKLIEMQKNLGFLFHNQQEYSVEFSLFFLFSHKFFQMDKRFFQEISCDIRIVLVWDTDVTNVELLIEEPGGGKCHPLRVLQIQKNTKIKNLFLEPHPKWWAHVP